MLIIKNIWASIKIVVVLVLVIVTNIITIRNIDKPLYKPIKYVVTGEKVSVKDAITSFTTKDLDPVELSTRVKELESENKDLRKQLGLTEPTVTDKVKGFFSSEPEDTEDTEDTHEQEPEDTPRSFREKLRQIDKEGFN